MVIIATEPKKSDTNTGFSDDATDIEDEDEAFLELGLLDKSILDEDDDDLRSLEGQS